jgi:hypothetical protein
MGAKSGRVLGMEKVLERGRNISFFCVADFKYEFVSLLDAKNKSNRHLQSHT